MNNNPDTTVIAALLCLILATQMESGAAVMWNLLGLCWMFLWVRRSFRQSKCDLAHAREQRDEALALIAEQRLKELNERRDVNACADTNR